MRKLKAVRMVLTNGAIVDIPIKKDVSRCPICGEVEDSCHKNSFSGGYISWQEWTSRRTKQGEMACGN